MVSIDRARIVRKIFANVLWGYLIPGEIRLSKSLSLEVKFHYALTGRC